MKNFSLGPRKNGSFLEIFSKNQIDKLTGVYFPYWVVDAEVDGQLQATGTSIRIWRVGDIEYTETKRFNVGRSGKLSFKELVKNALSKKRPTKNGGRRSTIFN
ncbi:hypothetical protein EfsSVR2332_14110 [Enterococcus faecalis]|uniref:Uncharacterized protein n=1 Tax=Enterococcus faecalis TaxID=1351 RepID=A0AC59HNN3_ENTFL|nr:hypothetical protein EfsSVR2332_14110 [Enterococcus faecalis]